MNRLWPLLLLGAALSARAEDFSFDLGAYEKHPYEWSATLELSGEHAWLDRSAAFYNLNIGDPARPSGLDRFTGAAELEGLYRFDRSALHFRGRAEWQTDNLASRHDTTVQELYLAARPSDRLTLEAGKRVLKWGKGYAWNPVAFVERPKDPNDPDLAREGYVLATADAVRSFDGALKTLAFTPVLLPVADDLNTDFADRTAVNVAAKLYLLYRDTDIDLYALGQGSRSGRVGIDFSRNLGSNLELHGELAYAAERPVSVLDAADQLVTVRRDATSALLGFRYLTESDITWIAEYYHNGAGYSGNELARFYSLAKADRVTDPVAYARARVARGAGYGVPNPGLDYLYLRASGKDAFGVVYLAASLTSVVNLHDGSFSVSPELLYTGFEDAELRLRLTWLQGGANSEFEEKQNDNRVELRYRYFF